MCLTAVVTSTGNALLLPSGNVLRHQNALPQGQNTPILQRRILPTAQTERLMPPAQFVWAGTSTTFSSARPKLLGAGAIPQSPSGSTKSYYSKATALHSASTGNSREDATSPATTTDTFVLDAHRPATELKDALERRNCQALTPYNADAWERLLQEAGILDRYATIPEGLRHDVHIKLPTIVSTQIPLIANQSPSFRKTSSAPSKPRCCPSYPNQESPGNIASYRPILFPHNPTLLFLNHNGGI